MPIADYLKEEWAEVKRKYKRDKCGICGYTQKLRLHHNSYHGMWKSLYITLCDRCHKKIHFENGKKLKMPKVRKKLKQLILKKIYAHL